MWNLHIDNILKSMGFTRLTADHGVYFKWDGANRVWLALYVDDIFLTGKNLSNIEESKRTLGASMKESVGICVTGCNLKFLNLQP